MTTLYGIWSGDETIYFPTRAAAMREARLWTESMFDDDQVDVTEYKVTDRYGKRELFCHLLAGEGWAAEQTLLVSLRGKRRNG